jgi:hypothetical protein
MVAPPSSHGPRCLGRYHPTGELVPPWRPQREPSADLAPSAALCSPPSRPTPPAAVALPVAGPVLTAAACSARLAPGRLRGMVLSVSPRNNSGVRTPLPILGTNHERPTYDQLPNPNIFKSYRQAERLASGPESRPLPSMVDHGDSWRRP